MNEITAIDKKVDYTVYNPITKYLERNNQLGESEDYWVISIITKSETPSKCPISLINVPKQGK